MDGGGGTESDGRSGAPIRSALRPISVDRPSGPSEGIDIRIVDGAEHSNNRMRNCLPR